MKKFLILGTFILGTMAFSSPNNNMMNNSNSMHNGNGMHNENMANHNMNNKNSKMGRMESYLTAEEKTTYQKDRLAIEEKNLEIKKLMISEKPDWSKIEKINVEIGNIMAKNRTLMMKKRFELKNTNTAPTNTNTSN